MGNEVGKASPPVRVCGRLSPHRIRQRAVELEVQCGVSIDCVVPV